MQVQLEWRDGVAGRRELYVGNQHDPIAVGSFREKGGRRFLSYTMGLPGGRPQLKAKSYESQQRAETQTMLETLFVSMAQAWFDSIEA